MKKTLGVLACLLFLSAVAHAQGFGSIVGTVTDPSGAVVAGASVTVTEVGTSFPRSANTNPQGYYVLSSLRPAQYNLSVAARGFRTFTQKELSLLADQTLTVNMKLELGATSEVIEVTGTETQVDTSTSTLKHVVEGSRMLDLPLNGRNAAELTLGVPGAVSAPSGGADQGTTKTFPGAVTISANGSRQNQISYQLDGGNNVDEYTNVNQPFPFPDALQEFSVQTSNYTAQYGQNAGAVVNIITKSGTNSFHGDLFEFNRNAVFNARNAFAFKRDQLKRNQFGGTVGGPIIKDHTFFFAGYQGTRLRNVEEGRKSNVPTQAQINTVSSAINPASQNLLKFLPLQLADASGAVTYSRPDRRNIDEVISKVDHFLKQSDRLTFRHYYARFKKEPIFEPANILSYLDGSTIVSQNYLIHESHVFNSNLLNDFRFSYSREKAARGPADNVPSVRDLGVNIPFQPSKNAIQQIRVQGLFNFGDNPDAQFVRNNFTWGDDVSWVRGRHHLGFGGTLERSRVDINNLFFQPAEFSFGNVDNFLRGRLSFSGSSPPFRQGAGEFKNNRNIFAGVYIMDDFRVSRRLTLNFGLRYEPFLPWREIKGRVEQFRIADFLAGVRSRVFVNAPPGLFFPGDPGVPNNGTLGSFNNLAPRVGFAYDVFGDGKTSVRGGAGIFYDTRQVGIINNRFVDVTPFSPQLVLSAALGCTASDPGCIFSNPLGNTPNPFPAPFPPPSNSAFPTPVLAVTYDPSTKYMVPALYNWNLTIEREVSSGWLVRAAYVGSHGSHIKETVELNPAPVASGTSALDSRRMFQGFASVTMDQQDVNSSYNALQLSLERRLSRGLTVLGNYTYSRSIDSLPVGGGVTDVGADQPSALPWFFPNRKRFDRGPSDFDHTHRFVVGYVWQLPALTNSSALLRHVLGDWTLSGSFTAQAGRPFTVLSGKGAPGDSSQTGLGRDRAQILGDAFGPGACTGVDLLKNACTDFLIKSSFADPPIGTFGNVSKNSLRWPGLFNSDMGFIKNFKMKERWKLQFRAEFFNIFNRVNLSSSDATINSTTIRTSASFGSIRNAEEPRIGQLALKILF